MVEAKVNGLPDLRKALQGIVPKLRVRALRNALAAGARVVQKEARAKTPVLSMSNALVAPHRKPGTVKKAISVRTSKRDRQSGDVGVFVNVRPAKRGQRGAKSQTDPFYWQWLEFGWTPASGRRTPGSRAARRRNRPASPAKRGYGFLQAGAGKLREALQVFIDKIGPAIEKLNKGQTP